MLRSRAHIPWLLLLVLATLHPAGARAEDEAPKDAPQERLRRTLLERFLALPVLNHRMEGTAVSPGEPECSIQVDLWREGDWASFDLRLEQEGEVPGSITMFTDGALTAMQAPPARAVRVGPGVERQRAADRAHDGALQALRERLGVVVAPEEPSAPGVEFTVSVRRAKEDRRFGFKASMAVGGRDPTPSWLEPELWQACTVDERATDGTVLLREDGVELLLRTSDGLPLRWEAHDDAAGRHVLLTTAPPSASPKERRERVRALAEPLRPQAREPNAVTLAVDGGLRSQRVAALVKAPIDPAARPALLEAWASWLVETEATVFALDDWKPEAAAAQRDVVLKALLAAIRELAPRAGWPAEHAARLADHVSARWSVTMEPKPSAPASPTRAR